MKAKVFTFSNKTRIETRAQSVRPYLFFTDTAVPAYFVNASHRCVYVCAPVARYHMTQNGNATSCSNVSVTRRMLSFASSSVVP